MVSCCSGFRAGSRGVRPGHRPERQRYSPRSDNLPTRRFCCGFPTRQDRTIKATAHCLGMRLHSDGLDRGCHGLYHYILASRRIFRRRNRVFVGLSAHHPSGLDLRTVDGEKKANGAHRGRLALGNRNGSPDPNCVPCLGCCQKPSLLTSQSGECAPRLWRTGPPSGARPRRSLCPLPSPCW